MCCPFGFADIRVAGIEAARCRGGGFWLPVLCKLLTGRSVDVVNTATAVCSNRFSIRRAFRRLTLVGFACILYLLGVNAERSETLLLGWNR